MAKQSVRQGKTWSGKKSFYQPEKYALREMLYRGQIRKQLPKDFVMFTKWVKVVNCVFVHEPTATMLKNKGKRLILESGGFIPKTTKPDLIDNLNKLPFDSMSKKKGLKGVFKDDSLVCEILQMSKVWGLNPRIEIELIGV